MSEEKKLMDEEIAKAILQQIEYNAGIPYINEWQQVKTIKFTEILDFINRLQSNNEELKKDYIELDLECRDLRTELDKKLAEHEKFTKKAKVGIERLKINLANEKKWGKIQAKQAEKETASNILGELDLFFKGTTFRQGYEFKKINEKLKEMAKNYDVGVDYEN